MSCGAAHLRIIDVGKDQRDRLLPQYVEGINSMSMSREIKKPIDNSGYVPVTIQSDCTAVGSIAYFSEAIEKIYAKSEIKAADRDILDSHVKEMVQIIRNELWITSRDGQFRLGQMKKSIPSTLHLRLKIN